MISKKLKLILILLLILINSITLSGCWNSRELNTLGIVGIFGFDIEDDKVKVSVETFKPSSSKDSGEGKLVKASYIQATGDSIFDTVRNITVKYDRKLFFPHIKFCIFSEEAAKSGLIDFIDWYQRDHEPRLTSIILIAKDSTAEDIMGIYDGLSSTPADFLEKVIGLKGATSKVEGISVLQFLKTYYSSGINPVTGIISKETPPPLQKSTKSNSSLNSTINTEGAAVFKKGALVGYLDGKETRGFNFITNKVKSGIITLNNMEDKSVTSLEVLKAKSKNSVELINDEVILKVNTEIMGMIGEETSKIKLNDITIINDLEKKLGTVVKKEIEDSIKKVQNEYESDIFGFGNIVHRKYPKEWKEIKEDWNNIFSKAKIEVKTKISINRNGLVNDPANRMEEK